MKTKIIYLILIAFFSITFTACDKNFEQMNKSQDLVIAPTLDYMIPTIQLNLFEKSYYTHYTMLAILDQQIQGSTVEAYQNQGTTMSHLFDDIYPKTIKNVVDVIEKTKSDPTLVNYWAMASIMRAYEISRQTDAYGDVPYKEAGLGYEQQIVYPKYDKQQDIYYGICNEIEAAIKAFDPSKKLVPKLSDIVYGADMTKWKKFGYSLMLRYGMRMSNVDPAKAKLVIAKAIAGGLMTKNDDSFVVYYLPDTYYATTANGNAAANKYDYKLTDVFINLLKNTNDPRLSVYSMLPDGTTTPASQLGFKLFASDNTSKKIVSTPNTATYARFDSPYVHMSYAETEFLLAEAILRGWVTGDATAHFQAGIRANMEFQSIYGSKGVIPKAAIDTYIASTPFNIANYNEAFTSIYTQMWIMLYYNWNEAFANWRRTGVPSFNTTIDAKLSRRLIYPQSEWNSNGANVREAIARQGDDNCMTRMWWDKK